MAPVATRRSQPSAGVGKKVHRKRATQRDTSGSWDLLESQGLNPRAEQEASDVPNRGREEEPMMDGPTDVEAAVQPLREMAERVGKEAETFAEQLDKFFNNLPTAANRFNAAHDLVMDFREITQATASDLKKSHQREIRDMLKQEWSAQANITVPPGGTKSTGSTSTATLSAKKAEHVKQVRRFQQEADIWELFRVMLQLHPFERDREAEREEALAKFGQPHRYTTENDLWLRFLAEDDLARERHVIKTWLEHAAENEASDVQGIIEELESKAGRGKGLWSSGWMHTREKIKGEKRLRSWPSAVDSPLPQIRRSDNNELLVTTLDPDSYTRQQRTLEQPDSYFEKSMWIACWEMIRRGKSVEEVIDWCEERKEGWRAVITGQTMDDTLPDSSNAAWRHMCYLASQSGYSSDYEAAVFGYLGGNVKAMQRVCHTLDDHLYAYYSSTLVRHFDQYLIDVCPEKASPQAWRRRFSDDSILDPQQSEQAISDLISKLRASPATSDEAVQPMKIIESFLLADEVGSLVHTVGAAVAETAALHGPENMIFLRDRDAPMSGQSMPEAQVALDPQTLRIATHMAIVHRILSPEYLEGDELLEDENVLVAYIQSLRAAGKLELIPIYASKLQRQRYIIVLGRILQDITEPSDQRTIFNLLGSFELDVVAILTEQLSWTVETCLAGEPVNKPLRILEQTDETKLHPGQRIIVDFLPDEVNSNDDAVVRCLGWYQLLRGGWQVTFEALTVTLRRCLVTGRFACARMILQNFPYDEVATRKSFEETGHSVNPMETTTSEASNDQEAMRWDIMKRQSRTYYELEQLVLAVETLSTWRTEEHKYVSKAHKPSTVPSNLKKAKERVTDAMEPLLAGILQNPVDEGEAEDLKYIRFNYLPEIIIAYNTVLHAAGNLITRDSLLESMDLSVVVAKETPDRSSTSGSQDANGLAECFVQAGRMRELVTSFALTSKVMMVLKAEGKPWKARKDREGKDLGVWEIGNVRGHGAAGVED